MLARSSRLISSLRALDKVHMKYNENVGCACIPWGNFARTRYYSKRKGAEGGGPRTYGKFTIPS